MAGWKQLLTLEVDKCVSRFFFFLIYLMDTWLGPHGIMGSRPSLLVPIKKPNALTDRLARRPLSLCFF